jgi:pyridoxal phosphate enzyme (YggS family)
VNVDLNALRARLEAVRGRVAGAAKRSGRAADAVTLIGVVKTVPAARVCDAVRLGVADLGENRVQEAEAKIPAVGGASEGGRPRWHMIGHLQRNKAGKALAMFDMVHGVDDAELAETIARRALALGRRMPVLIEVNVSGEASKFGVQPQALPELLGSLSQLEALGGLLLRGLMTVGAPVDVAEQARAGFARLRDLRDDAEHRIGHPLPELSMGMSGDYEVAAEEGATLVRVGSALFGARH